MDKALGVISQKQVRRFDHQADSSGTKSLVWLWVDGRNPVHDARQATMIDNRAVTAMPLPLAFDKLYLSKDARSKNIQSEDWPAIADVGSQYHPP